MQMHCVMWLHSTWLFLILRARCCVSSRASEKMFIISPLKLLSVALVTRRAFFCPLGDLMGSIDLEPGNGAAAGAGLCTARRLANAGVLA
jgi:hypothetical protein